MAYPAPSCTLLLTPLITIDLQGKRLTSNLSERSLDEIGGYQKRPFASFSAASSSQRSIRARSLMSQGLLTKTNGFHGSTYYSWEAANSGAIFETCARSYTTRTPVIPLAWVTPVGGILPQALRDFSTNATFPKHT